MAAKKKKFNPRKPIDSFNQWPRQKYPIKWGSKVYFFCSRIRKILVGTVRWYHPARKKDASATISPGRPLYRIRFKCGCEEVIPSEFVSTMSEEGLARLSRTLIERSRGEIDYEIQRHKEKIEKQEDWIKFLSGLKHPHDQP